jgi:DNA-binding NtrC family response regulator
MQNCIPTKPNWREWRPALLSMAESRIPLADALAMFEKAYVEAALEIAKGNQVQAGQVIKAHRNTVGKWARHK